MPQPQAARVPLVILLLSSGSAFSTRGLHTLLGREGRFRACSLSWLPHPHSGRPGHTWCVAPIPLQMLGNLVFFCAQSHQNWA